MAHFIKEAVEAQDAHKLASGLPRAKYTLVVEMTANSHEELADMVHGLEVNWWHHYSQYGERDAFDSTDGRTSVLLDHTNPEQTPETYSAELSAWAERRRNARKSEPTA